MRIKKVFVPGSGPSIKFLYFIDNKNKLWCQDRVNNKFTLIHKSPYTIQEFNKFFSPYGSWITEEEWVLIK